MNPLLLTTAALLFSAGPRPDALRRERLPADVDFVLHFDLEGFQKTELWKLVQDSGDGHFKLEDLDVELGDLQARIGIDPLRDIKAVTLFKRKSEEDPTVALLSTTDRVDQALQVLQGELGYGRVEEQGIVLHTWPHVDGGETEIVFAYLHALPSGERVVVLASNKESALHAARVLRGEESSHAAGGTLTVSPALGSFLYAAAMDLSQLEEFSPASQVFGLAQGIQVDLGEAGGLLRAHMGVTTDSPQKASDVSRMIDGLIAFGSLMGADLGPAAELLRAVRLNTRGNEVMLDFEFGVKRMLELAEMLDEEESSQPR